LSPNDLLITILQLLLVSGIAFVVLCLITSFLRFQHMASRTESTGEAVADGLDAFQVQIAARLGTAHRSVDPFSILVIGLKDDEEIFGGITGDQRSELNDFMIARIRGAIRASDTIVKLQDARFGVIADTGALPGRGVGDRILAGFTDEPFRFSAGGECQAQGYVALVVGPDCGERVDDLIEVIRRTVETRPEDGAVSGVMVAPEVKIEALASPAATPEDPLAAIPDDQRNLVEPVSGVLKPEYLGSVMQKRFAQHRKKELPISVICIQIDHMDRYLDYYGESGRDAILGHLGAFLQNEIREEDLLGSLEDKRTVLIMNCAPANAHIAVQRLSNEFGALKIAIGDSSLKVTLSCGVAGYPDQGAVALKLLEHAQTAQEQASARGRGKSLVYDTKMESPKQVLRPGDAF
jgi:diguanylate cyclase (GGDEF)-like protein